MNKRNKSCLYSPGFSPPPVEHAQWFIQGQPKGLTQEVKWRIPDFVSETHFPIRPFGSVEIVCAPGFPGGPSPQFQDCLHFSTELNLKPDKARLDFGRVLDFVMDVGGWWDLAFPSSAARLLGFSAKVGPLGRRTRCFTTLEEKEIWKYVQEPNRSDREAIEKILKRESSWSIGDQTFCSYRGPLESRMDWHRELQAIRSTLFLVDLSRDERQCKQRVQLQEEELRVEGSRTEGFFAGEVWGALPLGEYCKSVGVEIEDVSDILPLSPKDAQAVVKELIRKTIDTKLVGQFHLEFLGKKVLPTTLAGAIWMLMDYYQGGRLKLHQCNHCGKTFHVLGRQANARSRLNGVGYCPRWLSPSCYRTPYEAARRKNGQT